MTDLAAHGAIALDPDTRDISSEVLDDNGRMRVLPAAYWTDRHGPTSRDDMEPFVFRLTLNANGTLLWEGKWPSDVGEVLRVLADGADNGEIDWGVLN